MTENTLIRARGKWNNEITSRGTTHQTLSLCYQDDNRESSPRFERPRMGNKEITSNCFTSLARVTKANPATPGGRR